MSGSGRNFQDRYTVKATATVYGGVKFRSFLEARWARLFDLIEIPWEYEPVHMDGWLPDFRLWGRFLVEVKPIAPSSFSVMFADSDLTSKAITPGWTIILGDGPGDAFGLLVSGDGETVGTSLFFYDETARWKMRSVKGDGGSDPCRGNLLMLWRETGAYFSRRTSPSQSTTQARAALDRSRTRRRP